MFGGQSVDKTTLYHRLEKTNGHWFSSCAINVASEFTFYAVISFNFPDFTPNCLITEKNYAIR